MQEGTLMFSMDLGPRKCGDHAVVALRGELDLVDAADVAAAFLTLAAREPRIIVNLAGLDFIDCRGAASLMRGRANARDAGGDLLFVAPQQQVRRVLAIVCPADDLACHVSVEEAAASEGRSLPGPVPRQRDSLPRPGMAAPAAGQVTLRHRARG
jgi:anti-sigma B factor antagonist